MIEVVAAIAFWVVMFLMTGAYEIRRKQRDNKVYLEQWRLLILAQCGRISADDVSDFLTEVGYDEMFKSKKPVESFWTDWQAVRSKKHLEVESK